MKEKKYSYFDAKAIAKQNSDYAGVDDQGVSLPWEMHFFSYPVKTLDIEVRQFCHRSGKSELLLVDNGGTLWRYYTDIDRIQKTRLQLDEAITAIESIEELLIVQFKDRIEAHALANGQIVWSKEVSDEALLRKADDSTLILYEHSTGEMFLLNAGGETLSMNIHRTGAVDIAGFDDYRVSILRQEQRLHIQDHAASYTIELQSDETLLSIDMIDAGTMVLLLLDPSIALNKLFVYTLHEGTWKLEDSLLFRTGNLLRVRRDCERRLWHLDKDGKLGYVMQDRQYLGPDNQFTKVPPLHLHIDSLTYANRWHRMLIDYDLPDECALRIEAAASEETEEPSDDVFAAIETLYNDLLLPELKGRHLFLRLFLTGDQAHRHSPLIRSIKLLYPRSTYLEYLPAYYQEDEAGAAMLERFLSIFETVFSTLEDTRNSTPSLIDSNDTLKANLTWLSRWLGLTYDDSWDEERWRLLMREAPGLFGIRGTREGIERVIEIYSKMRPLVYEPMHAHCMKTGTMADMDNYSFCLFLKPEQYHTAQEVETIRRITEEWKPAYTKARVVPLENRIVLGSFLFLGVNTRLERKKERLGEARMPFDGIADARKEESRALERVRIGSDAVLH
jgi:phage tail-like protein